MPVTDFECQIARGQIGRYLDGGVLSPQALTGLEEHLAECPGCKAAVADRRTALLGTLNAPTHAVVSMPVENPLVAALRARAEEEPAASKGAATTKPTAVKAAPRYAKGAKAAPVVTEKKVPGKSSLNKTLALAAVLAVVLVGMGRISHTATGSSVKASTAFAAESLPEKAPSISKSVAGDVKPPVTPPKEIAPEKPAEKKADRPSAASAPGEDEWGGLMQSDPPAATTKPAVPKPKVALSKPKVHSVKPRMVRPRVRATVRRVAKPVHRPKVVRRAKAVRRAPRTTVRVYGLDGRPLKP